MSDDEPRFLDGFEHRRGMRYPVPPQSGAISVVGAQLVNISAYGALIESLVPMETDAVMPLRLIISGTKTDIEARVVQCNAAQGEKRRVYRIGLEFVSTAADVRERLSDALKVASAAAAEQAKAKPV